MGQVYSYFLHDSRRRLCDDLVDDLDFSLQITIYSIGSIPDYSALLEHLQLTNPVLSYWHRQCIYLLYSHKLKHPHLRSNVSGDIISTLSAEIAKYCIMNNICELNCVEIDIIVEPHQLAHKSLLHLIKSNEYGGKLYGIDNLSEEKIREQFC